MSLARYSLPEAPPRTLRALVFGFFASRNLTEQEAALLGEPFETLSTELRNDEPVGRSAAPDAAFRLFLIRVPRHFQGRFEPKSPDHQRYLAFLYLAEAGKATLRLDKLVAVLDVLGLDLLVRLSAAGTGTTTSDEPGAADRSTGEPLT